MNVVELDRPMYREAPSPALAAQPRDQERNVGGRVGELRVQVANAEPSRFRPDRRGFREVEEPPEAPTQARDGTAQRETQSPQVTRGGGSERLGVRGEKTGRRGRHDRKRRPGGLTVSVGHQLGVGGPPNRERVHVDTRAAQRIDLA